MSEDRRENIEEEALHERENHLLLATGLCLLAVTVAAFVMEARSEWSSIQQEAREVVAELKGEEAAETVPSGIKQIWVEGLHNTVDRCVTCHVGVEWEGLEDAPQPFTTHPYPELLKTHPIEKYGCTVCHGGQGYALDKESAHGFVPEEEWPHMLLGKRVREVYGLGNKYGAVEINCNKCHRYETETAGLELINLGKTVADRSGCDGCHSINGEGGAFGPKLDIIGQRVGEHFNFTRLKDEGDASVVLWHFKHFERPQSVSPNSIMTKMAFTPEELKALTLLMLSWVEDDVPRAYFPAGSKGDS